MSPLHRYLIKMAIAMVVLQLCHILWLDQRPFLYLLLSLITTICIAPEPYEHGLAMDWLAHPPQTHATS